MGIKAEEALDITPDELEQYLRTHHSVYIQVADESVYYLTDVNDHYWRVQHTDQLNEKGHYVDASELVPTVGEFMGLPFKDGKCLRDVAPEATFYASIKE